MGTITILNKENISGYQSVLPPDIAENIGRKGYCGIAQKQSVLVFWQSQAADTGTILFYAAEDCDTGNELLAEYEERLIHAGITKSEFELPASLGKTEQETLQKNGYLISKGESKVLYTTISHLASFPVAARCELSQSVKSTGTLSIRQFQQGICNRPKTATLEDALTISPAWFDHTLSCCVQIKGSVCGYLLIHRLPSGALRPELFYVAAPAGNRELLDMIRYVLYRAQDQLAGETPVIIPRVSLAIRSLTDKLLPGLYGDPVYTAAKELSCCTEFSELFIDACEP